MWLPPEFLNGSPVDAYEVRRYPATDPPGVGGGQQQLPTPDKQASNPYAYLGESVRYRVAKKEDDPDPVENFCTTTFKVVFPSARFCARARNEYGWSAWSELSPVYKV